MTRTSDEVDARTGGVEVAMEHAHWLLNYALELEHAPAEHTSGALQVCGFWFHFL